MKVCARLYKIFSKNPQVSISIIKLVQQSTKNERCEYKRASPCAKNEELANDLESGKHEKLNGPPFNSRVPDVIYTVIHRVRIALATYLIH